MKRFIALFLALTLSLSVPAGYVFADENSVAEEQKLSEELIILNELEIISESDPTKNITKGEFLKILYKLYFADTADSVFEDSEVLIPYVDVKSDSEYYGAVCFAYKLGLIGEMAGRKLNLESNITIYFAADILTRMCGYPKEATSLINSFKRKLKSGVSQDKDSYLNVNETAIILYNALTSEVVEPVTFSKNEYTYGSKEGVTLFYVCRGICFGEGELTETPYNSLYANDGNGRYIKINGINLVSDEADSYIKYIGYKMRYFYKEDKSGYNQLLYAMPLEDKMNIISINDKEIIGVSGNSFMYYDKNGRKKSINMEKGIRVLYNGELYNNTDGEIFKVKYGNVKFINNDNDSAYDVALIFEYDNYTVYTVDKINKKIVEKYNGGRVIDYGIADETSVVRMRDIKGNVTDELGISEWNVITALISKDGGSVDIIVSNDYVVGEVTNVNKLDETVTISGEKYELWEGYERSGAPDIVMGMVGTFYLDAFGKIAAFKSGNTKESYACLIDCAVSKKTFENTLNVKLLTSTNEIKILEAKNGCKIDGIKYTGGEIPEVLNEKPQVICYYLDKNGLISAIKTSKSSDNKSLLRQLGPELKQLALVRGTSFQDYMEVRDATLIFKCPWDGLEEIIDEDYEVIPKSRIKEDSEYNITGYSMGGDSFIPDIIMIKETKQSSGLGVSSQTALVKEIMEAYVDGNAETVISVLKDQGNGFTYTFRNPEVFETSGVRSGDIILYTATEKGQILDMKVIFSYEDMEIKNAGYVSGLYWGDIAARENSYIGITRGFAIEEKPNFGHNDLRYYNIGANLFIVDSKNEDGRGEFIRRGTLDEMRDYKHYGSECGRAVVKTSNWWIAFCVVYI